MLIETPQTKAWLIGDPHFGKDFRNGTPLHRRGERERMQREQFIAELDTPDVDTVVMVGDLFDRPFIPLPILGQVINDVVAAALARPKVQFVMMAGNHDLSRQLDVDGAWDIFRLAVSWLENVRVVEQPTIYKDLALFPWCWGETAAEQATAFLSPLPDLAAVIGHWDMKDFGGDTSHLAPVRLLQERINPNITFYSGHFHEERTYTVEGVNIHCTGSMQPYAHGEGEMYLTLTLDEALARDDLHDKCVRVLLEPGEVLPDIDCLQLSLKRNQSEADEVELREVGIDAFNLSNVLEEEFNANEVPDDVRTFIKERMSAAD